MVAQPGFAWNYSAGYSREVTGIRSDLCGHRRLGEQGQDSVMPVRRLGQPVEQVQDGRGATLGIQYSSDQGHARHVCLVA